MFEATRMLFIYVETPLHAGSGRGLGAVDLPIQRERTTNYPIVQASSLKGRMRGEAYARYEPFIKRFEELKTQFVNQIRPDEQDKERAKKQAESRARRQAAQETGLEAIFGPEAGEGASDHAGAISFGDARVLLFPVRSLAGVFAWTTSVDVLERFKRATQIANVKFDVAIPPEPGENTAWVNGDALKAGDSVVLEEFSFTPDTTHAGKVQAIGKWLADNALPQTSEYKYWREALPSKLCILPENAFRDFVQYGTEVQTHIKIDPDKKTVSGGALWTSESLPTDTLLYAPVMATDARTKVNGNGMKADQVLQRVVELKIERTQLGGDETTGQGFVALRFSNGGGQ
jgi:CRISPR-associated protein Cmr4